MMTHRRMQVHAVPRGPRRAKSAAGSAGRCSQSRAGHAADGGGGGGHVQRAGLLVRGPVVGSDRSCARRKVPLAEGAFWGIRETVTPGQRAA
eukprot:7461199-Alexandrium_andersonii.AAC.1